MRKIFANERKPHLVYRFYDRRGRLLYVGCTVDPKRRFRDHRCQRPWWSDVAEVTGWWYPDQFTARDVEARAIATELPIYNVQVEEMVRRQVAAREAKRAAA